MKRFSKFCGFLFMFFIATSCFGDPPETTTSPRPPFPAKKKTSVKRRLASDSQKTKVPPGPPGPPAPPPPPELTLQLYQDYQRLTNGYGHWWDTDFQATYVRNQDSTYRGELAYDERFGDKGESFSLGTVQSLSRSWYGSIDLGSSAGGFFLPTFRGDLFAFHKWLPSALVTYLGATYVVFKDVHRTAGPVLGLIYYFPGSWILETGFRLNVSDPGTILGYNAYAALTYGFNHACYLVARAEYSREAYQLISTSATLVNFQSWDASLSWKQWIGRSWGVVAGAETYDNPFYQRYGGRVGFFAEF